MIHPFTNNTIHNGAYAIWYDSMKHEHHTIAMNNVAQLKNYIIYYVYGNKSKSSKTLFPIKILFWERRHAIIDGGTKSKMSY